MSWVESLIWIALCFTQVQGSGNQRDKSGMRICWLLQRFPGKEGIKETEAEREYAGFCKDFQEKKGLLYHVSKKSPEKPLLAFPKQRKETLLKLDSAPMAAHLGRKWTLEKLSQHFYWPGMCQEAKEFVRQCTECQKVTPLSKARAPLMPLPVISTSFDRIAIAVIGPLQLTEKKNRYIMTVMDVATRYRQRFP